MSAIEVLLPSAKIRRVKHTLDLEPWFVCNDLCAEFDIEDRTVCVAKIPREWREMVDVMRVPFDERPKKGHRRFQKMHVVSLSGALMIVMRSRKPKAQAFAVALTELILQRKPTVEI